MAKIHEEYVIVKVSKLVKDADASTAIVSEEVKAALGELLAQTLAELTGDAGLVVEVAEEA
jgi:histone H3/H4